MRQVRFCLIHKDRGKEDPGKRRKEKWQQPCKICGGRTRRREGGREGRRKSETHRKTMILERRDFALQRKSHPFLKRRMKK